MGYKEVLAGIDIPFYGMGAISSLDLFCDNELPLFEFYWKNRERYKRVCDFGANIGLHSIFMHKCGWEVRSFEPDKEHLGELARNLERNNAKTEVHAAGVSYQSGTAIFIRVLGNTTGNHIIGAKKKVYGQTERSFIYTEDISPHMEWADFVKMDIEGHEADVICALPTDIWKTTHGIIEVGSPENARRIIDHIPRNIGMYRTKDWRPIHRLEDMPQSHRDGNLFIGEL